MTDKDRYACQIALPEIGAAGQARLRKARALIVGCGALGTNVGELLVRAGVGKILVVDYDIVEFSNLQRQALVTENDVGRLKAEVLVERLSEVNSEVKLDYQVVRIDPQNVEGLVDGVDVVFDGLDNFPSRYLVNDACVKHGIPWVFGAVAGTYGETMPIIPGQGPCLRCLFPEPPPDAATLTAETSGMLNAVPRAVAAIEVATGIKIILNALTLPVPLVALDLWDGRFSTLNIARDPACPCCGARQFEFL